MTAFDPAERHPAGDYPNQSGGGDGLPTWTAADRPLVDTDVVELNAWAPKLIARLREARQLADVTSRLNVDATWKRWRLAARFDTGVYFATPDSFTDGGGEHALNWCGDPKTVTARERSRFCSTLPDGWPTMRSFAT